MLFLRILVTMTCRTQGQEDQREHCEDEGLNEGDEDFEEVERYRANEWQQEPDDQQQHAPREEVAKETEAKRDDAGHLENRFEQADEQADRTFAQVEVTTDLRLRAEHAPTVNLGHHHRDDGDCQRKVEV